MHLFKPPPLKLMCLSLIDAVSVNKNHTLPFNVVFLRTRLSIAKKKKKRGLPINLKILPVISIKAFIFQTSLPTQTQFIFYHSHQLIYWPFPVHTWPFCHCIIYFFHFNSYRFFKVQSSFYLFFFLTFLDHSNCKPESSNSIYFTQSYLYHAARHTSKITMSFL